MATRKSEWLASIKPILDRDEAKKDAAALAKELGDILEVKVDASPENLSDLAKEFNAQLKTMGKQPIVFSEKTLRGIVSQFSMAITSGIKDGIDKSKILLKDINSLQEAYKRNKNASGARTGKMVRSGFVNKAKDAFDYEPSDTAIKIGNNLRAITNEFSKATSWEEQYVALLKYIKAYEKLESVTTDPKSLEKWATIGDYAIQDLKEARPGIEHSLQNIFNVAYGKVVTGLTDAGDIDVGVKLTPIKMIDVYDVTGGKGHIEVEIKPIVKKAKKNETPNAFRGVHKPSGGEGRSVSRTLLGGDFWTDNDGKALFLSSYGEESGEADAKNLSAVFKPLNRLIVDAEEGGRGNAKAFNEIDQLKFVQHLFPGIENFINTADTESNDYVQKFYNEMARQAGFDLFEVANVNEGGEELATTLVPLQDRIIEWASKIPEYYDVEKFTPDMERDIISRQKGSSEKWYTQTIERLESQMAQAVATEDITEVKYLQDLIPRVKEMYSSAMANFDDAIVSYGGYIEESVLQGLPEVISANADGKLVPKFSADELRNKIQEFARLSKELDEIRDAEPNKKDYGSIEEYEEAKDLYDDLEDTYQQKIDLLYNQLINGLPNDLQNEVDNLLIDAVDGAVNFEDVFSKLQPHLTYDESVVKSVGSAADDAERKAKADKEATEAKEKERLEAEARVKAEREAAEAEAKARAEAEAREKADKRRNELAEQLELYNDDEGIYNLEESEDQKAALQEILNTLKQENLLTDELQARYDAINSKIDERIGLLKSVKQAYNSLETVDNIDYNMYDVDEVQQALDKRKEIINAIPQNVLDNDDDIAGWVEEIKQGNLELEKRIGLLQQVKQGLIDIDSVDDIISETGDLDSKLSRLGDVASAWGSNVKDSEVDEDDAAIEALEEFEETYDRIVLKLANGRNIEILPNAKGLRALYKYYDGIDSGSYGESEIEDVSFERVKRGAVTTEQAVDELNKSLEKTEQLTSGDNTGSGTGDASLSELEEERARVTALQNDLDAVNKQNEELREQLANANAGSGDASSAELEAAQNEAEKLRQEKERLLESNESLRHDLDANNRYYGDALWDAEHRANEAEERANQLERKLAESFDGDKKPGSVNTEELKTLLNSIVYNVKIVHDDNDKTANKIALDDYTLEATLTKVFANILNPQTQQNDSEQKQAPWALENTLQTVKGVLDNIQTNTSKIGTVDSSNVDTIAGTALDGRLTEIKSVLESINQKIVDGGKIFNRDGAKQAYKEAQDAGPKQTSQSNMFKSLQKDYENMGKLSAQFSTTNNLETKAMLENLKRTIARKREELKLTMEQNTALRKKYSIAFDAEKRLLDAAKAQEKIDKQMNQDDRDEKAAWKKKVKDAQRATGINAATSAANAGDQTVLRAIGTDGVSKDIENKAKELSNQIKTLRILRDEIDKKGNQAFDTDRDSLSKQISKVKELKTEVDAYLKIHEKYSGDNVTDLGDASNFGAVGTDQYWNNITEEIKKASSGKTTIKGLNADTGELTGTTKIAANTFATWSATVDPLTGRLSMLRTGIKKTETLVETITRKTKEIFTYFSGSSIIFKAFNELKKGVQYVRDIDLALTELKKVTDETEETYRRFLDTASKTAAKVGSTIKDVVSSTADWARLGYSMKEAAEFAESTQILMNVSEFTDVSQATDTLISAVQAFGYTAETSMDVVDLLNTIGNNYAISTADLAQSLTKSSASLVAAGGDLAEAAALTATANAIIQDADSVGTALKTTSLRLRGTSIKVLEEEGLDSDGAIESTSKLRSQVLATAGVDILTDSGAYKSTYQILLEIAEVWDRITDDKARAGLLELLAGKRNSSVIAALLQNPEKLEAAYKDAKNAEGSALKENEKYLDSIQGKIDQFNNTIQTLWSNTLDSDWVKRIVEAGTWLFKILDTLKPISVLIAGIAVYLNKKYNFVDFSNLFTGFKEAFSSSKGPKDFFKNLKNGFQDTEISIEKAKEKLRELEEQKTKLGDPKSEKNRRKVDALDQEINAYKEMLAPSEDLIAAQNQLNAAEKRLANYKGDNAKTIQKYEREVKEAKLEVDNLTNAQQRTGKTGKTAFSGLGKGVKAFGKQVASVVSQMLIMLAITKIVELLFKAFDALITTPEEAAEKYEELNSELDTLKDNLKTIEGELSAIDDKMADLIAKGPLTFVEQEELDRLKAEREELERTLELNEQLAKQKQQQVNNQTSDQVEYYRNKGVKSGKTTAEKTGSGAATGTAIGAGAAGIALTATGGAAGLATALGVTGATQAWNPVGWGLLIAAGIVAAGAIIGTAIGAASGALEEKVGDSIENMEEKLAEKEAEVEKRRAKYQKTGKDGDRKKYEEAQKALSDYRGEMAKYFTEIDAMYQNVDLSTIEDPDEYKRLKAEMNDFYNERDKWLIKSGAEGAESNAIERIFSKDDYKNASDTIDTLVEKLKKDPTDQSVLSQISEHCKVAEADLQAVGSSVDAARNYFTMLGQNAAFDTLGGKTAEITSATSKLQALLSNIKSADFTGLFGRGGEVNKIAIAEYFQGTSEATRTEIAKLVKSINDDKISVEDALKQFEYFGIDATIDIYLKENAVNLEEVTEKIDNIQDAYSALSDAVTQYNENGYLTLDNLQALLSLKPEYLALLQMENGQLSINQSAMETMVQAKLADAKATVIQSAMEQLHALASRTAADEVNNSATAASNAVSSLGEYASALGTVSKDAIVAAGAVTALNAAVAGAKANELVDQSEIDTIMSTMNNSLLMIDNLGANLSTNFKPIMGNDTDKDKDGKDDDEEDKIADGWEKLLAKYENKLALLSNERDLIQAEIDKAEAQGGKASAKYYEDLKRNSEDEKNLLIQKKAALEEYLAANAGAIDQDTWTEYNNEINATAVAIKECEINTIEWAEAIREIDLHYFEQITDEVSRLGEELDFVNSLLEDEEVADENGNWSSAALTRMGMYTNQLEMAAASATRYQEKIDDLGDEYENGAISEEQYQERLSDLVGSQQDAIMSYEDAKDSIVEMNEARIDAIREGIDKEIEAYEDLIDAKKEELDAERELHDFRENIKDQTKDIASLERRIAALSGSSAASDIAERRKLEAQLLEAKEGLNNSYYDHSRDAQSAALDEESEAFQLSKERYIEQLEEQLKDAETLIQNSIMDVMLNADIVYTELNELADIYGVDLSDSLTLPWKNASAQAIAWKDELKESMTAGEYASLIGEGGAITAFANGVTTKLQGSWTKAQTAAQNYAGYLTGTELKNRFSNTLTGFGNQIQGIIDKWNGVKSAADNAYQAQLRVQSVGGSSNSGSGSGSTSGGYTPASSQSTPTPTAPAQMDSRILSKYKLTAAQVLALGYGPISLEKFERLLRDYQIKYSAIYKQVANTRDIERLSKKVMYGEYVSGPMAVRQYAKGTAGTPRDEWAITDESQFGDELVLVPGKDGNLSFMRKGTGVVPADMTQKLFELAQIPTSDLMNKNLTAIVPNITKNEFKNEFNFESLVHVDTVDSDTLPKLEKMVDKKIDDFSRALNYSLKKFSR